MGDGKELDAAALRKMYQGYPTTLNALLAALDRGWRVCKSGHGVRVFCPLATQDGCMRSVAGSSRSNGNETNGCGSRGGGAINEWLAASLDRNGGVARGRAARGSRSGGMAAVFP